MLKKTLGKSASQTIHDHVALHYSSCDVEYYSLRRQISYLWGHSCIHRSNPFLYCFFHFILMGTIMGWLPPLLIVRMRLFTPFAGDAPAHFSYV